MSSYQYSKSHCGDKTVVRSSYLHNGISYTGKMTSLYWIRALGPVSLTFRQLSKEFSRNLYIVEIVILMCILSWNFVRAPKRHALCTRTKFQLEILTVNVIYGIVYFREIILESSCNVSETTPGFNVLTISILQPFSCRNRNTLRGLWSVA